MQFTRILKKGGDETDVNVRGANDWDAFDQDPIIQDANTLEPFLLLILSLEVYKKARN